MLNERLKCIRETVGKSQSEFAQSIGLKQGSYSGIESGKKGAVTDQTAMLLKYVYNVNIDFLYNGIGGMFIGETPTIIESDTDYAKAVESGMKLIPEVAFKFSAGKIELVEEDNIIRYWGMPDCQGNECIATVEGVSMSPMLPSGSRVLMKPFGFNPSEPNTIPFGQIFGVVVEDESTGMYHGHIKKLRRHKERSSEYWIAQSTNPEFDDFEIKISQVRGLWVVKKHIVNDFIM